MVVVTVRVVALCILNVDLVRKNEMEQQKKKTISSSSWSLSMSLMKKTK